MKKIININLSGHVIPIEDSAYQQLQDYLESLRRYFANEEGRDEIINDIESRIAELMSEQLRKGAYHITEDDVTQMIRTIGRPEDFDPADGEPGDHQQGSSRSYTSRTAGKRLYRDTSDKFVGGVCSGIANYLNIDPAIMRILFAIIGLGGWGIGILIYILLWIILPARSLEGFSGKRLYRNPDDRVFGGVAGGLAAYFNRSTWEIRLIFAAPFLLNLLFGSLRGFRWDDGFHVFPNFFIGSITSTFCLAYIILWIVLPEARSSYQKMEMRGEPVDLNSIRQNVKEGMEQMKERMKDWSKEVNESASGFNERVRNFNATRGREFGREFSEAATRASGGLGHAIGVLFKVLFFIIIGSIAFGLIAAIIALLFGGIAWWPINNFLWTSDDQKLYALGTIFFFLLVPLVSLIIWIVRRMMRVRSSGRYLGWAFGFFWTLGWISIVLLASSIARDFSEYEHVDSSLAGLQQPQGGRMIVTVSEPELTYSGNFAWVDNDWEGWDLSGDTLKMSWVNFSVDKSDDSLYHVDIKKYSAGRSVSEAQERAAAVVYQASSRDSLLDLGSGFAIASQQKFRGQKIEIYIKVPVGKQIRFDHSVTEKLNSGNVRVYRSRKGRVRKFTIDDRNFPWWNADTDYTMLANGSLSAASGSIIAPSNSKDDNTAPARPGYRYQQDKDPASSPEQSEELRKQLEEEKRIQKESEERAKELEKKLRTTGRTDIRPAGRYEESSIGNLHMLFSPLSWS